MAEGAGFSALLALSDDALDDACLAYHEAGHAVAGLSLGIPICHATLVPSYHLRGSPAAAHVSTGIRLMDIRADALVRFMLAGPAAERRYCPLSRCFDEAFAQCDDFQDARLIVGVLCRALSSSDRVTRAMPAWHRRAEQLVDREWAGIVRVAAALQQWRHLSAAEITRVWREAV